MREEEEEEKEEEKIEKKVGKRKRPPRRTEKGGSVTRVGLKCHRKKGRDFFLFISLFYYEERARAYLPSWSLNWERFVYCTCSFTVNECLQQVEVVATRFV